MRYKDWPRQFDVALRKDEQVRKVFEAKDYKGRVPFEKVEAFETKVREMKVPPLEGAGVISSHGFQEGPIVRARDLPPEALVRDLYELREAREEDWQDHFKSVQLEFLARSLDPRNIRLTLAEGEAMPAGGVSFTADRNASFLYDATGRIKGNVLDQINSSLRAVPVELPTKDAKDPPKAYESVVIDFDDDTFMRLDGHTLRVRRIEFTPEHRDLRSSIAVDFSTGARDTLVDALNNRRWIIPDPGKAVSASRQGYHVALTYETKAKASLAALSLPSQPDDERDRWSAQLTNALQTQAMLRVLGQEPEKLSEHGPDAELFAKLEQANQLLLAGQHEAAKALYWETCAVATSLVALVNLTFIYEREKDLDQALRLALRTVELFPLEVDGFKNWAAICMARGKLDEAREVLDVARDLHAAAPDLLRVEAELLRREERWAEAAAKFSQVCTIHESDAIVRLNLAVCESAQKLYDIAAWDAKEAFRLGLESPDLVEIVVNLLRRARQFDDAVAIGSQAIAKAVESIPAARLDELRIETTMAAYDAGQRDVAQALIEPVQSDTPPVTYLRGLLQYARGDACAAYDSFRRYVTAQPDDRYGWHNLSVAATDADLYAEAHAALHEKAFEADDTRDFWAMRTMAAARAGDHADAVRAAERAAAHGVDAANLLIAASNAALQVGEEVTWAQLRMAALPFDSDDGPTVVEQIHMRVGLLMEGRDKVEDIDQQIDRAEQLGTSGADLAYARMMVALCSGRAEQIVALTPLVLEAELPGPLAFMLAAEASMRARSELALKLLDRYRPEPVTAWRAIQMPHPDAIRAATLLRLGRPLDDIRPLVERLETLEPHPLHDVVAAYWCYGLGEIPRALALLDRVGERTRMGETAELPLRLQCLVEMGRYTKVAELLRAYFPSLPVTVCAARWSHHGDADMARVQTLLADKPQLGNTARLAAQVYGGAEHVLLILKDGELSRVVTTAHNWEAALVWAVNLDPNGIPILVRVTTPIATIQRLLGPPVG